MAEDQMNGANGVTSFPTVGEHVAAYAGQLGEGEDQKLVEEIESLCMNCQENGTTRLLLTRIPYFREIILMSFACPHCHLQNTEVQSAGEIQPQGSRITFRVDTNAELQRQIVKSDTAVFKINEIDLEVPAGRGRLTNIEGLLSEISEDLAKDQDQRRDEAPEVFLKIQVILAKLKDMLEATSEPFSITLDDPAGNSSVEPSPEDRAGKYTSMRYQRTIQQNASLGLASSDDAENAPVASVDPMADVEILSGQVYTMPCQCPGCGKHADMNMQMVDIPYFKQVIITAVSCNFCGYRTNEVKTGGEIPARGKRIWLKIEKSEDLSRDILKSETCLLKIPECTVEVQPGTMGGRFTTVEGLITQMRDDLRKSIFDIGADGEAVSDGGDSMPEQTKLAWNRFFSKLDSALKVEFPFEILLEDPIANSYVQSFTAPEPDPQIREEEYDRTEEEEDELGISHMRTEMNEAGEYVAQRPREREDEGQPTLDGSHR